MITATQYVEKKKDKLVEILKIGNAHAMAVKHFDEWTSKEIAPEVFSMDIDSLRQQKAKLVKEIENMDILIADLEEL